MPRNGQFTLCCHHDLYKKKLGRRYAIFANLTARTLNTYKYEVVVNNDKLSSSSLGLYPRVLPLEVVTFFGSPRAPVRFPRGRPISWPPVGSFTDTFLLPGAPEWRTPGHARGVTAEDRVGTGRLPRPSWIFGEILSDSS